MSHGRQGFCVFGFKQINQAEDILQNQNCFKSQLCTIPTLQNINISYLYNQKILANFTRIRFDNNWGMFS